MFIKEVSFFKALAITLGNQKNQNPKQNTS